VRIRRAVQTSNLYTNITIGDKERCVTDWLTWRKDVAPGEQKMIASLRNHIESNRNQLRTKGITVGSASVDLKPTDIVVNLDEGLLARQAEALEEVLGTLDGKLSLLNATTYIDLT
jgi:hypothetical protein